MSKSLTIEQINKVIEEELKFAKQVNPQMALGMAHIQRLLNDEVEKGDK